MSAPSVDDLTPANAHVISCSVFVPVPSIVVKSHQTLEAILPYLPLSLTTAAETEDILLQSSPDPLLPQPALPAPPGPDSLSSTTSTSTALATSSSSPHSTALVLSSRQDITSPSHPHRNSSTNNNNNQRRSSSSNSNRISPDSSIPATTCIKISLHPTPSFKFVKPKCPHQHQKNRNRRHFQQQQQQQQQQHPSSFHSHSHSHSRSHSHSHSHSHDHGRSHRSDSYRHSNSNNSTTTMASLEYPQQTSTTATAAAAAVGGTVTVKFTYPVPSTNSSTPVPELVQVTGTFNSWQRSQPLTCNQDQTFFEGDIPIDIASLSQETDNKKQEDPNRKKILFKFVLDGQSWVTDPDQEVERDHAGNLNNVLFITNPLATATTTVDTKDDAPTPPAPAVVAAEVKTETTETEEEKAARLKQEAEDDETIRQLGGGMWGAPYFAVNDPAELPEHFPAAAEDSATKEAEVTPAPVTPAATTPLTTTTVEKEKEAKETVAEKVDAPAPAAVEPVVQVAQITVESSPAPEQPEQPKEEEVEDEDDKIIKALGGGMWGTPFFKVNDPTALPEHFQEALVANAAAATISASSPSPAVVSEEVTDKDGHNIHIVKDEITTTVGGGKLIETEVTEIIETIEEEEAPSAAAEVQGTQVVVEDEGAIEFVETILEQTDADDTIIVPSADTLTPPEMTMTESETTTSVQGEDGVETTIIEDTLTFSEGPEVDAGSLHSLTTGVKPVTQGESVVVEQSPEVVVAASAPSSGDAKPSVDESVEPLPLPSLSSTTVNTTATAATPST
ncbi:hypothetical protein BGZ91_003026, partial [Linnemannia elongata]